MYFISESRNIRAPNGPRSNWSKPSPNGTPNHLIRDRDAIYGEEFRRRIQSLGIKEIITAPQSPWQNAFAERLIGSIRRECLDHIVVLNQRHLRKILSNYLAYYHRSRTHLALEKDAPEPRAISESRRDYHHSSGGRIAPPLRTLRRMGVARTWPP
jgi:transposase InsO family protein